uniref:PX domain-containing protein n=1 Tax=Anopheles quadriannulatus TaxID=34691 RepID=A0A182X7X6_ANOQN
MPVVVEGSFQQSTGASSRAMPSTTPRTLSPDASEAAAIAMIEVSGSSIAEGPAHNHHHHQDDASDALVGDSTFINGCASANGADLLHPWNGTVPDLSRSPSVGDTFVSAAASSDMPYPSSFADSTTDSDSGPEEEEADLPVGADPFAYITTATITLSSGGNTASMFPAMVGHGATVNLRPSGTNALAAPVGSERLLQRSGALEGQDGASPSSSSSSSSSGKTSISMSIASVGDDSTERELNESPVSVQIVPEKKGLFLKHSEYEIKLKGIEKTVRRRYKDFVTLHRYLAEKYPYRLLPALPPKQLMLDSLLEERRRGLQTWLIIVSLHPVLGSSPIVSTFLRDTTTDHQYRLRVTYEKQMDELVRLRPDATLPEVDLDTLAESRTRLHRVQCTMGRLKQLFDRRLGHNRRQTGECAEIERILQSPDLRDAFNEDATFEDLSASERLIAKQVERYVQVQQRAVTERLDVLLEVLHAHSQLCERIEKGIVADQQRTLTGKSPGANAGSSRVKVKAHAMNQTGTMAQQNEGNGSAFEATQLARRSAFAFSCAQAETLLAERYLQSLPSILLSYAHEEQQHHQKMSKIWHRLVVSESSRLD